MRGLPRQGDAASQFADLRALASTAHFRRTPAAPPGTLRAGETLTSGIERVLAEHFGFSSAEVSRYLGHNDHAHNDGRIVRVFVFAVAVEHPDSICHTAHIGHRWIDNITISDTVDGINPMLRVYYADNSG